jgi:hypothetical protein
MVKEGGHKKAGLAFVYISAEFFIYFKESLPFKLKQRIWIG